MGTISTPETVITFDQLSWQRVRFALKLGYSYQDMGEISRFSNYFAPDYMMMYDWERGDQQYLWDSRWRDGELWSAFLAQRYWKGI